MSSINERDVEFTAEFEPASDLPFYLRCANAELRAEARRAYILPFITDNEGVLLKNWEEEAVKLEAFLKTSTTPLLSRRTAQ